LPKVEALLKQAVALDPKLADAHFQLGLLYQEQSNLSAAIREFELAVKLRPDSDTFHYRLGQVYQASGQAEKAKPHFERYRELHNRKVAVPDITKP
jgi:tetratricopeptide (TPR) repeat protein